jgi:UDP-N-acetylmuramate--alanine ligase
MRLAGLRTYFIGIGGSGMSGLARVFAARGAIVRGSDQSPSASTQSLAEAGITVEFDQAKGEIPAGIELVVASAAIKPDHPQWAAATRAGIAVMLYAEALGRVMQGSTGVAIAGTHGKSTTTGMLGSALVDAGLDPGVIVGATSRQLQNGNLGFRAADASVGFRVGSARIPLGACAGQPGILVAEACEYNRSFHNYRPMVASISSVEADHLDVYGTLDAVVESFRQFALLLPPASQGGKLLIAHDNAHRREVTAGVSCEVRTIGFSPEADWVISYDPRSRQVRLSEGLGSERREVASWRNSIPGAHNAFNASVALVLASWLGADVQTVARSLAAFRGVDRRLQLLGERPIGTNIDRSSRGVVRVFDDYGHHPTEVDVTLRALRESERPEDRGGRLICVFQPHQHSRTKHLMEEFASSFSNADVVIVPHIYFVRDSEEDRHAVTAGDLVDRLRQRGVRAMHLYPFEAIIEQLGTMCRENDVVVVMGAGDVWKIGEGFLKPEPR